MARMVMPSAHGYDEVRRPTHELGERVAVGLYGHRHELDVLGPRFARTRQSGPILHVERSFLRRTVDKRRSCVVLALPTFMPRP